MDPIEAYKMLHPSANAFCPTGKGGGKDPTCSPGKSGSGGGALIKEGETFIDEKKFFKKGAEFPSGISRASEKLERGGGFKEEVEIKSLIPTQEYTGVDKVKSIAADFQESKVSEVLIVRKGKKDYIYDGHHTAAAARLVGETKVKARIVEA